MRKLFVASCHKILEWLVEIGYHYQPDQDTADLAARYGRLEVLKWLAQTKNLYPGPATIMILTVSNKHPEMLRWLHEQGRY